MYGIDFGTSNTVVTAGSGGSSRVLDLGEGGVLPSLLYFERDRRASVGHEAMADYTDALLRFKEAGNLYSRFRFFQALKLALKDRYFEGTAIFGEYMSVENLVAIFLREVKRRADLAGGMGSGDDRLVLGRPVQLSDDNATDRFLQDRFAKACRLAGFSHVDFVHEPVAAAVGFIGEKKECVLVFDLGGGTLDISIARMEGSAIRILATAGQDLGGYLLDEDISRARITRHFGSEGKFHTMTGRELSMPRWITDQVASFYALPLADLTRTRKAIRDLVYDARDADKAKLKGLMEFLDKNLAFGLFKEIDEAKIELSTEEKTAIRFEVKPFVAFCEEVTRDDFEALVKPRVDSAMHLVMIALGRAGLDPHDVARVVRVGGSSRVPAFVAMLEGLFPGRVEEGEVFTSIAAGLLEAKERGLVVAP